MLADGPTPVEAATLDRHHQYVDELVHEGTALLVGRTVTSGLGGFELLIFRADDHESAERLVAIDPALVDGVVTIELLPFRIAMLSATWEG